ncbi:hypothetical protein HERIO_85 [Hepatospora eriocheir]|uniref:Uncharacterized protein n=1 Tax=Hepatospora eriocheir TaxID=1081669 RepID=A0A1X0QE48_9MICR|nr:hypothetical protein HERIO_85 [Hepatospora eriocheir]
MIREIQAINETTKEEFIVQNEVKCKLYTFKIKGVDYSVKVSQNNKDEEISKFKQFIQNLTDENFKHLEITLKDLVNRELDVIKDSHYKELQEIHSERPDISALEYHPNNDLNYHVGVELHEVINLHVNLTTNKVNHDYGRGDFYLKVLGNTYTNLSLLLNYETAILPDTIVEDLVAKNSLRRNNQVWVIDPKKLRKFTKVFSYPISYSKLPISINPSFVKVNNGYKSIYSFKMTEFGTKDNSFNITIIVSDYIVIKSDGLCSHPNSTISRDVQTFTVNVPHANKGDVFNFEFLFEIKPNVSLSEIYSKVYLKFRTDYVTNDLFIRKITNNGKDVPESDVMVKKSSSSGNVLCKSDYHELLN